MTARLAADTASSLMWHARHGADVEEAAVQADLLRCVAGNPFRVTAFDPAWRTSAVVGVAEAAYEAKAWDRLPILADALQDAGCEAEALLSHLRSGGPRCRGCWVLDLLLGKQ